MAYRGSTHWGGGGAPSTGVARIFQRGGGGKARERSDREGGGGLGGSSLPAPSLCQLDQLDKKKKGEKRRRMSFGGTDSSKRRGR